MVRRLLKKGDHLINRTSYLFVVLSGMMITLMAFTATYGVVRRYIFNSPEPYSYELSTMFLLWTFVLAVGFLEKSDGHLRVDFFIILLPEKIRDFLLKIISPIVGLIFCVVLTWKGWEVAVYSLKSGEKSMYIWAPPLFPIKFVIPIGYGLLCMVLIAKICHGLAPLIYGPKKT
jgi:TRAP-type C4-dicarboxylate transport system permease small subunit